MMMIDDDPLFSILCTRSDDDCGTYNVISQFISGRQDSFNSSFSLASPFFKDFLIFHPPPLEIFTHEPLLNLILNFKKPLAHNSTVIQGGRADGTRTQKGLTTTRNGHYPALRISSKFNARATHGPLSSTSQPKMIAA